MTDAFASFVPEARHFFAELEANNSKAWFEANKARYTDCVRKPAEALGTVMAAELGHLTKRSFVPRLYRINRDVRFAKDKSPYNAHLHMLWSFAAEDRPGWFLAVSPRSVSLSAGVMGFSAEGLDWARHAIADDPQPWLRAVQAVRAAGGDLADWGEPPLKRVPKPWENGHPAGDLLRRKSLILTLPVGDDALSKGLVSALCATAERLLPFWSCFDAGEDV